MSDTTTPPPAEEAQAPIEQRKKGGRKKNEGPKTLDPNTKTALAIKEVMERKKQGKPPAYAKVAAKYGISSRNLQQSAYAFRKGELVFRLKDDPLSLELTARQSVACTNEALDELQNHLTKCLLEGIKRSKEATLEGKLLAYRDTGVMILVADLQKVETLRGVARRKALQLMQELNREKEAKAAVADANGNVTRRDDGSSENADVVGLRRLDELLAESEEAEYREEDPDSSSDGDELPADPPESVPGTP